MEIEVAARNDVTGDAIKSKTSSKQYSDNWERIFGKKDKEQKPVDKKE